MRCKIQFEYDCFKDMDELKYAEIRKLIPELPAIKPTEHIWTNYCTDIVELSKLGVTFKVVETAIEDPSLVISLHQRLLNIEKTLEDKGLYQRTINLNIEQSHDMFLTQITEVEVKEDYCTEDLQRSLNDGWRIVAVCYQKGNRRPDYVLGKIAEETKIASQKTEEDDGIPY